MVLFDNKTHDEGKRAEQVNKLLSLVDEIKKNNNGQSYTDDMYNEIKQHTDKLSKELEELEAKKHPAELESELKDKLHASFEESMTLMSNAVEKKLKAAVQAQEILSPGTTLSLLEDMVDYARRNPIPTPRRRTGWEGVGDSLSSCSIQ
ncbi:unnamed protein product [Microthlaspi erraticum]|uniref:AIG1-type G domain-containing protein n=1 Tax=Microthlaspi erraticum TaxID=1685480 RepID=A0A6D2KKR0_9BRAS|nr:unnamed protein product [Microthlaspi erraticum]